MSSLLEAQRRFGAALADARAIDGLLPLLCGTRSQIKDRVAIYRGNVIGNSVDALAGAYPVVRRILGSEFFDETARAYARAHPSRSADINEFGETFCDFLAAFARTQDLPYLPDTAKLEWLVHRAHFAADSGALDPARLAAVPPEAYGRLRLVLAPACALLESPWPVGQIWEAHQDAGDLGAIDFDAGTERVLVHRPRWRALVSVLAEADFAFLAAVARGAPLGEALQAAVETSPVLDCGAMLRRWIAAGAIAGFETK